MILRLASESATPASLPRNKSLASMRMTLACSWGGVDAGIHPAAQTQDQLFVTHLLGMGRVGYAGHLQPVWPRGLLDDDPASRSP